MKAWKIKGRFPTADEMSRMVAAEVRTRVEAALERAARGIGRIPMCLRRAVSLPTARLVFAKVRHPSGEGDEG